MCFVMSYKVGTCTDAASAGAALVKVVKKIKEEVWVRNHCEPESVNISSKHLSVTYNQRVLSIWIVIKPWDTV